MEPGQRMDAKIARRLWRAVVFVEGDTSYLVQQGDYARVPLPRYSTDIDESHRVVRFMQGKGYFARIRHDPEADEYRACFTLSDDRVYVWSRAQIMPMAICMAALAAFDGTNVTA